MAQLFQRDRSVISKHTRNVFREGELPLEGNVQKMHIASADELGQVHEAVCLLSKTLTSNAMITPQSPWLC
jgi:hypothetical protein